jgi:S-adenosylmethionine:tRNA ribosyltransferase-isomerase
VTPASWPRTEPLHERLLVVDPRTGSLEHARIGDLSRHLAANDVLVVNDAATLPASLRTDDGALELRLATRLDADTHFRAVLFGAGDFRIPTEERPPPRRVRIGEVLAFGAGLEATVVHVDPEHPRLLDVRFRSEGVELWTRLYRAGRAIQYSYVRAPLDLWHVQNRYSARPWAHELPSAGRPLTWGLLVELRRRGVRVASVTHAAGISSTGSEALDLRLPFSERYLVSEQAVSAVLDAKRRGGRVVAVGTTVVRALEASALAHGGTLRAGEGVANLLVGPGFRPSVVDGLLSGIHREGTTHFALLEAFAPRALLGRALTEADRAGYVEHEFGDSCLVLGGTR